MSPFSRPATRSSFRRSRRPARTFRTQWIGFASGTGVLFPDTSIVLPLLTATQTETYGLNQPTVIRIRGEVLATLVDQEDDLSLVGAQASIWMGLAVLDHDDTLAGGNPDDPFTTAFKSEWMFHRTTYLWAASAAPGAHRDARDAVTAATRFDMDVKSRRRIERGQTLSAVVVNPPIDPSPGNVGVAFTGRILLHEFGR